MNAIQFIESEKVMFFHWLFKTTKDFPRVCEYASDVLGSWLYHQFPDEQIEVHAGLYDGWSHAWIEVNGSVIVDFTVTQFLGGMDQDEEKGLSDELFYERYFLAYQPSPFFDVKSAKQYKYEEGLVLCQFDLAKWHQEKKLSFETYLQTIWDFRVREKMYNVLKEKNTMSLAEMQEFMGLQLEDPLFSDNIYALIELGTFGTSQDGLVFQGYRNTK